VIAANLPVAPGRSAAGSEDEHDPLSELYGVRGAAPQFNPWARSNQSTASYPREQQLARVEAAGEGTPPLLT